MLCNLISVDMRVHALQLKQKYTADVFHGILRNFRAAKEMESASVKKSQEEKNAQ